MNLDQQTGAELRRQLQAAEHRVQVLQARLLDAEHRADLAEKSARDSWAFARVLLRGGHAGLQEHP